MNLLSLANPAQGHKNRALSCRHNVFFCIFLFFYDVVY